MPGRERPFGIYAVLMIVSAVFLALAALVTYSVLTDDYDFVGTEVYGGPQADDMDDMGEGHEMPEDAGEAAE